MQEALTKIFNNLPLIAAVIIGSRLISRTWQIVTVCVLALIGLVMLLT